MSTDDPSHFDTEIFDTGTDQLLVESDGSVATLVFNRPEKHNALSVEMQSALPGALAHLDQDPAVRVIVVRGAGEKAFVSGADISEFGQRRTSAEARADYDDRSAEVARAWAAVSKPIIAMIRGYCIGGGLLTALQADIRIASDDSQFGVPAARLGLGYGFTGVEALAAVVGNAAAAEILFSARRLTAGEAHHMGLINRVVSAGQLHDAVHELAQTIAGNAPMTVAACKAALRELRRPRDRRDLDRIATMVDACFRSDDYLEGQRAFAERRAPRFRGR